jgi:hypothetical protein
MTLDLSRQFDNNFPHDVPLDRLGGQRQTPGPWALQKALAQPTPSISWRDGPGAR